MKSAVNLSTVGRASWSHSKTRTQGTRGSDHQDRILKCKQFHRDLNDVEDIQTFVIGCMGALVVSNMIAGSALAEETETIGGLDRAPTENLDQEAPTSNDQAFIVDMNASPDAKVELDAGVKSDQKSNKRKGRIRELEEIKAELAKKELELLSKENALLEKEQSMLVLRQELEIERNIRALITKEKEQAEEEAALAMGLCTGSTMLP